MSDRGLRVRFVLSAVFMLAVMAGLGTRLAFLHLGPHQKLRERVERNSRIKTTILAGRGVIRDRSGADNILAMNIQVKDVCANPSRICSQRTVAETASFLAHEFGLETDMVASKLNQPERQHCYVQRFVDEEFAADVIARGPNGIFLQDTTVRQYPLGRFMCHVLGFVNHEGDGSAGAEQFLDHYLRGSPGFRERRVDALRHEVYSMDNRLVPALEGANVDLTLDQNIQYFVEAALDNVMEEHNAKGAWAIVQRVTTGEILAMASRPNYDLNSFYEADRSAWLNRSIGCVYEPGSTFKAIVFSAVLHEGVATADEHIHCENGTWIFRGRPLRDYHPYGELTVADGLKKSSNIMSAKLALRLGEQRYYQYLRSFGIGGRLGIDLPGEEAGILHDPRKWSKISISRIAIGQGVAVTAMQMLNVYSTIANEGYMMKPYAVRRVTAADGSVLLQPSPTVLGRPISRETATLMRELLARVTEDGGTGRRARVDGYRVAGKTGTAQKPVNGRYSNSAHYASFVGFLPAEAPEIGIIVVVDEPQPYHTGGVVAGPAFSRIATQSANYLNIAPARVELAIDRYDGTAR